ncbi:MAG: histidinol phosphatase [Propionibacterium sp.]|nr:histidinol phosphatase [Propionibacterium sp.]
MADRIDSTRSDLTADLLLAQRMASEADTITTGRFRASDLRVQTKPDHTPVSEADKGVEGMVRATLATERPDDAVHGEEMPDTGWGSRRWIVDPIDGTANYVRGVPVWATLIGLMVDGEMTVGVVSAPALGRRWWASKGHGAFAGPDFSRGTRLAVSAVGTVHDAFLSYSSLGGWSRDHRGQAFAELLASCGRTRGFGDFFSYMLVAEGAVALACEPARELYAMAALVPIVTEAGGRFTNLEGAPGPVGRGALASNGLLHDEVLNRLQRDDH